VPVIQGLVQKPGPHVLAVCQEDGETMKGVVSGIRPSQSNLAQEAADLVGGQARSDNRTVEALTKIPDPTAAGRTGDNFRCEVGSYQQESSQRCAPYRQDSAI